MRRVVGELAMRDGWKCMLCNKKFAKRRDFGSSRSSITIDHIQPRSFGGSDELSNLRLAHRRCNSERNGDSYFGEKWFEEWEEDWLARNTGYDGETLRAMEESDNFRDIVLGWR